MTKELKLKDYLIGDRRFYSHVIQILIPIIIQNTVILIVVISKVIIKLVMLTVMKHLIM